MVPARGRTKEILHSYNNSSQQYKMKLKPADVKDHTEGDNMDMLMIGILTEY